MKAYTQSGQYHTTVEIFGGICCFNNLCFKKYIHVKNHLWIEENNYSYQVSLAWLIHTYLYVCVQNAFGALLSLTHLGRFSWTACFWNRYPSHNWLEWLMEVSPLTMLFLESDSNPIKFRCPYRRCQSQDAPLKHILRYFATSFWMLSTKILFLVIGTLAIKLCHWKCACVVACSNAQLTAFGLICTSSSPHSPCHSTKSPLLSEILFTSRTSKF